VVECWCWWWWSKDRLRCNSAGSAGRLCRSPYVIDDGNLVPLIDPLFIVLPLPFPFFAHRLSSHSYKRWHRLPSIPLPHLPSSTRCRAHVQLVLRGRGRDLAQMWLCFQKVLTPPPCGKLTRQLAANLPPTSAGSRRGRRRSLTPSE
jgi:hypothetical protein